MDSRVQKYLCGLAALMLPLALAGCANRGNPRPPSLHLPALAENLKADRIGDRVVLTWTTSDKTSDGLILHAPTTATICRDPAFRTPVQPAPCTPVSRLAVTPGLSSAVDTLPAALLLDPSHLLAYRVELLNPKGRSAGPSIPAFAPSGAAPPDPGKIHVTATRRGAVIEWNSTPSSAAMELTRTLVSAPPGPTRTTRKSPGLPNSSPKQSAAPTILRSRQSPGSDPGGLLDPAVAAHATYTYTAQRVRTVTLDGHSYNLRSAPSPAAPFAYQDVFPPSAPSGLESIASAPLSGAPSIDLSWDASAESDILGYNIYRAEASPEAAAFTRLNPTPVSSPSFRDLTAQPAHSYRYRVTAIDRAGNESSASPEIHDALPAQP